MDLDLKVYIPERSFEKVYRLPTPRMTLRDFEMMIKSRISLPQKITFHKKNDINSEALDVDKTLTSYGYGGFNQDPLDLYIFEVPVIPEFSEEESSESELSSSALYEESKVESPAPVDEDIVITVLNSALATSHIFVANPALKIAELLESYKIKIGWDTSKEDIMFSVSHQEGECDENSSVSEIACDGEVVLEACKRTLVQQAPNITIANNKSSFLSALNNSGEIESTRHEAYDIQDVEKDYVGDNGLKKIKSDKTSTNKSEQPTNQDSMDIIQQPQAVEVPENYVKVDDRDFNPNIYRPNGMNNEFRVEYDSEMMCESILIEDSNSQC